jgi:hypothetical protein
MYAFAARLAGDAVEGPRRTGEAACLSWSAPSSGREEMPGEGLAAPG